MDDDTERIYFIIRSFSTSFREKIRRCVRSRVLLALFFPPFHHIPVGIFLLLIFSPLFAVYQYVSGWEERGKNVENQLVLVIPCSNHTASSSYRPIPPEILLPTQVGNRVHLIISALLLSRHRIIPQRIRKRKAFFLFFQSAAFLSTVVWFHGGQPAAPPVGLLTAVSFLFNGIFSFECLVFVRYNTFQEVCIPQHAVNLFFFLPSDFTLYDFLFAAHFLVWCSTKSTSPTTHIFFVPPENCYSRLL